MSDTLSERVREETLARLEAAARDLLTLPLDTGTDDDVVAVWRRVETVVRSLAVVDHAVFAEIGRRHLDYDAGAATVAAFARDVLRISPGEARARARAAEAAGPRTTLTGEAVPPRFAHVAAAQAEGAISPGHARVIVCCIDRLPGRVPLDTTLQVERDLVGYAAMFDPETLKSLAKRVSDHLDPDGSLKDIAYRDKHRSLDIRLRADGSATLTGELTVECAARMLPVIETLARPAPLTEGLPDPRSATQRRHDALLDMLKLVERAGELPDAGGVTTTLILTMTTTDYDTGKGTATTGHGTTIAAAVALNWLDGETRVLTVTTDACGAIIGHTDARRLFTENQRLAFIARDRGCSFPGCDRPPQWTQSHHIIDHRDGGPTTTNNGTLLCGHHHRNFARLGWTCHMINGIPHWTPPHWIDPTRTPQRNTRHHPELIGV